NEVAETAGARPIPSSPAVHNLDEAMTAYEAISELGTVAILFKGVGTGGGKGMRLVPAGAERAEAERLYQEAADEAFATSNDRRLFVARLIRNPRHMEGQFFADAHGNIRLLGVRECSLQRTSQKTQERDITALLSPDAREVFL